jgi:hypothetical protein
MRQIDRDHLQHPGHGSATLALLGAPETLGVPGYCLETVLKCPLIRISQNGSRY